MLLVTFHGGSKGITDAYAYDTATGQLNSHHALQNAPLSNAELRGMVYANSCLYVVNGGKEASDVMCFSPPSAGSSKYHFAYIGQFLSPSLSKKGHFENSVGHPYAMVFYQSGSATYCFVSNQDTNVVAQATVAADFQTATIENGCQSSYLNGLTSICPPTGCVYLDGTFVASQNGTLPDVEVAVTNVPAANGGLSVAFSNSSDASTADAEKQKVQNSVRDLAISNGVLLVCDEPAKVIRLYSLPDGNYLGASLAMAANPTHLAIFSGGLYVSAGDQLFWSSLSNPPSPSSLCFGSVLTAPAGCKVGGVTFDTTSNTAYVAFQDGTGTTGSGMIYSYSLGAAPASPPVFPAGSVFASISSDTPEFLLFVP